MVAEREGGGLVEVGIGHAGDAARAEETGLAERHVRPDGRESHGRDLVVARHGQCAAALLAERHEPLNLADEFVEGRAILR